MKVVCILHLQNASSIVNHQIKQQKMKSTKTIYWVITGLLAAAMLMNAYLYFTDPKMAAAFKHLGFPDFFRVELAIAKLIGVIVLLVPVFSGKIKEWAYAGFGITFISAALAHYLAKDPATNIVKPLIFLIVLIISNIYYSKTRNIIQ
jgi:uncharacterized membrane protein